MLPRRFPCMSSAIFLYFSDYSKLKLIYTLASLAKVSWLWGASWTGWRRDCFPAQAQQRHVYAKELVSMTHQLLAKRKGRNQKISQLCSWEGRAHWHWWDTHIFWLFFPLKAPGVLGDMRLAAFGIRKESTTQSNTGPREKTSLNREVSPIA